MPIDPGASSSANGSPQQAPPSVLAGMQSDDTSGQPPQAQAGTGNEGLAQAVAQIRQFKVGLVDMARQYPAAAPALRKASDALQAAMQQIVSNSGSPEPAAPNVGG
jgi:hypothetical protein